MMGDNLNGLRNFLEKYASLAENRKQSVDIAGEEFQDIRNLSVEYKKKYNAHEGAKEVNRKKNRYKDILPYDYSRVKLPVTLLDDGSDYINANLIKDYNKKVCYIASQGPMPSTVNDFWKMVWTFEVKLVIMACKEIELGKPRCQRYWPMEVNETEQYKDINVKMVSETSVAHNMMLREILVNKKKEQRVITQLHYMDWPDHGAPETTETILHLAKIAREKQPQDTPPILVHCSAGCGRTGAIIAIDYARKMIEERVDDLDVIKIVSHLREQRPAMVQTKEQYEFIYEVMREMVTKELSRCDEDFHSSVSSENLYENIALVLKEKTFSTSKLDDNLPKPSRADRSQSDDSEVFSSSNDVPSTTVAKTQKHIVLPHEHAVNMGGGFRRSRSQRKESPSSELKSQRPPLPRKTSEQVPKFQVGPELPGKSPSATRQDANSEDSSFVFDKHGKKHPPLPSKPVVPGAPIRGGLDYENVCPPPPLPLNGGVKLPGSSAQTSYENIKMSPTSTSPMADEEFIPVAKPVDASSYPMKTQTSNIKHSDLRHRPVRKNNSHDNTNKRPFIPPNTLLSKAQKKVSQDNNQKFANSVLDYDGVSSTRAVSTQQSINTPNSALYAPIDNSTRVNAKLASLGKESRVVGKPQVPTYSTVEKNHMDVKKGIMGDANKMSKQSSVPPLLPSSNFQWTLSIQPSSKAPPQFPSDAPPLPERTPESLVIIKEDASPQQQVRTNSFGVTSPMQEYTSIDDINRGGGGGTPTWNAASNSAYKHLVNSTAQQQQQQEQQRSTSVGNVKSHTQPFGGISKMFQKNKQQDVKAANEKSQSMPDYKSLGFGVRLNTKPRGPRELPVKFK